MIYHLLYPLAKYATFFNVFRYITFRAAMATLTAMVLSFIVGPMLIRRLKKFRVGQVIRAEGPSSHRAKEGTPTMGGILIVTAITFSVLLWADLTNRYTWFAVSSLLAFGLVGFIDDYLKLTRNHAKGMIGRIKLILQFVIALAIGLILLQLSGGSETITRVSMPFFKDVMPNLGWLYLMFCMAVIVGACNAVNLTDGLDGLAIGAVLIASGTFTILCYIAGNAIVSNYLNIVNVRGTGELTIFCAAMVGSSLGFLWFNAHPAQVYMGDIGALGLGGAIGTIAVLIKQELLLLLVGGLFVIEALSVIIQVASYKLTGKRVFKMAPFHHHFELLGWSESKIVVRFWIIAFIFTLLSLSTLKLR
jgi:phospho-N-acetylmuramoyl-pentapeptide-transferase